jgi:3-oxoacyl-[acyl-carrier protein] reductase
MKLGLEGRCALVCAASKGLGRASAAALAAEGASVAICGRDLASLTATASEIARATGGKVVPIQADVSRAPDVEQLIDSTVTSLGGLDVLVTNTGGPKSGPFTSFTDADWQAAIDSLLMSVVRLSRAAIPHMRARGGGRIINITSISAKQPIAALVLSNTLRAGITGLWKTLALELAADRITVNCVAPGYTATDRVMELNEAAAAREGIAAADVQRRLEAGIPLARMGSPEEFGAAVAFLASQPAAYITGVTLQIDGGWTKGLI